MASFKIAEETRKIMKPLLSLCIPTYNRSNLLREALQAIVSQINEDIALQIEIVISNNVSTDDTELVCIEFQEARPDISWTVVKQSISLGADNVQAVTKYATGEYIWILSDDDLITSESLKRLFDGIKLNFDIIITNHNSFENDSRKTTSKYFKNNKAIHLNSGATTVEFIGTMISFLSIICFRKSLVDLNGYKFAYKSSLPQSYMFMDAILNAKSFIFLDEPVLSTRLNNTGGYQVFQVFIENFRNLLAYGNQKGLSVSNVTAIKRKHLRKFLIPLIVNLKTKGIGQLEPNWSECRLLLFKHYKNDPLYFPVVLPLLYLPTTLLKSALSFRARLKNTI